VIGREHANQRRRFFASATLRSPGGFNARYGIGAGCGGSSFGRIALKPRTRGDSGKRSRSIVSRSSSMGLVVFGQIRRHCDDLTSAITASGDPPSAIPVVLNRFASLQLSKRMAD
jgi:hypothetical protein